MGSFKSVVMDSWLNQEPTVHKKQVAAQQKAAAATSTQSTPEEAIGLMNKKKRQSPKTQSRVSSPLGIGGEATVARKTLLGQ